MQGLRTFISAFISLSLLPLECYFRIKLNRVIDICCTPIIRWKNSISSFSKTIEFSPLKFEWNFSNAKLENKTFFRHSRFYQSQLHHISICPSTPVAYEAQCPLQFSRPKRGKKKKNSLNALKIVLKSTNNGRGGGVWKNNGLLAFYYFADSSKDWRRGVNNAWI